MNQELWNKVMKGKSKIKGNKNSFDNRDVNTILALIDYFGADKADMSQTYFDLVFCKYRMFDFLAMCVMGRIACKEAVKVLIYSFLKNDYDEQKFIDDLRVTDYDLDNSWREISL